MHIVYNMETMDGIKQFKDKRHGQQFADKLNIGAGYNKYNCVFDKKFYDGTCQKINNRTST